MSVTNLDWPTQSLSTWTGAARQGARKVVLRKAPPLMPFSVLGSPEVAHEPSKFELFSEANSIGYESVLERTENDLLLDGRKLQLLLRERAWQPLYQFTDDHRLVPSQVMFALVRFPDLIPVSWGRLHIHFLGTIYTEKGPWPHPHLHRGLWSASMVGTDSGEWWPDVRRLTSTLLDTDAVVVST